MAEHQVPPVHTLPRDVLIEIFSRAQSEAIAFGDPNIPIWQISLVCTSWHEIVFNTPQLWGSILLNPRLVSDDTTRIHNMTTSWKLLLERSGACSLDLSLRVRTRHLPLFLAPCFEHTNRWEHVAFYFPLDRLIPFVSNRNISYPRLRSVSLRQPIHRDRFKNTHNLDLFTNAPLLRTLSLIDLPIPIRDLKLPWSQTTHCDVRLSFLRYDTGEVVAVSKLMPNLISFKISRDLGKSDDGLPATEIEFRYLRKLILQVKGNPVGQFFDSIRAPCLKEIELLGVDNDWSPSVERFLLRSGCHITSATFGPSVPIKIPFLIHFPYLQTLSILFPAPDKGVLRELTIDDSQSQSFCPELKRLTLPDVYVSRDWWEDLACMLESRLRLSDDSRDDRRKLESLHIINWVWGKGLPSPPLDMELLRALEERLVLRYKIQITCNRVLISDYLPRY